MFIFAFFKKMQVSYLKVKKIRKNLKKEELPDIFSLRPGNLT